MKLDFFRVGALAGALLLGPLPAHATPVSDHPRLWLTSALVQQLRDRATTANPFYKDGIAKLASEYKAKMDSGELYQLDTGTPWKGVDVGYDIASGAEVFAFMSQIEQSENSRMAYGQRARTLVMYIIDRALVHVDGSYFDDPQYSSNYRGNFHGQGLPLAVDWAYGYFSAEDKQKIARVFMRWVGENLTATTSGMDHPEPVGVVNDSVLFQDKARLRNALNNFGASHMRNITLMSLALDPADEPAPAVYGADNKLASMGKPGYDALHDYIKNATGAWLYMVDEALARYSTGGVPSEGFEYNGASTARMAETYLALRSSGYDDPAVYGPQVQLSHNPFWEQVTPSFFQLISPTPKVVPEFNWIGEMYLPANYGDLENYYSPDFIGLFGPLGVYDILNGSNSARLNAIRWIEKNAAPGGANRLLNRASDRTGGQTPIFYYMLFDPSQPEPTDPRPSLNTFHAASGMNSINSRTGWDPNAAWLSYILPWNDIDHQQGTGNMVQFWRGGEWITKERSGYGYSASDSSFKNTLAIQNDSPGGTFQPAFLVETQGTQPAYIPAGDPTLIAYGNGSDFTYISGDATNLYNADYKYTAHAVQEARRSVFWLKPDAVVVYDRARTDTDGKFKRFWLNFTAEPQVQGAHSTLTTPGGQAVALDSLLPVGAQPQVDTGKPNYAEGGGYDQTAVGEMAKWRIRVDAPGNPADAVFLNVLQAQDSEAALLQPRLVSDDQVTNFQGASLGDSLVLFARDIRGKASQAAYHAPVTATKHYLTGIDPGQSYDVAVAQINGQWAVTVMPAEGGAFVPDNGGVLAFSVSGGIPAPINSTSTAWFTSQSLATLGTPDPAPANDGGNNGGNDGNGAGNNTPPPDVNGHLAALDIAGLSPAFDPAVTSYTVSVPNGTCSVPVTATLADPSLKLHIQSSETASGASVSAYVCNGNPIDIVTYVGWTEAGRYTLTPQFTQANPPVDPSPQQPPAQPVTGTLSGLTVPGLLQSFSPDVHQYTALMPASGSLVITATLVDPSLKMYIQSSETASGQTRSAWVAEGQSVDIVIYQNWNEVGRYTVTPVYPVNGLVVPGLSPAFSPNVNQYTVPKPASGSLAVTATLGDPSLKLYIQSNETQSGQIRNAWVGGGGSVDIVVYKNWNEVARYTVTPQ